MPRLSIDSSPARSRRRGKEHHGRGAGTLRRLGANAVTSRIPTMRSLHMKNALSALKAALGCRNAARCDRMHWHWLVYHNI